MSDFANISDCFDAVKKDITGNMPKILNSLTKSIKEQCSFDVQSKMKNTSATLTATTEEEQAAAEIDKKFKELSKLTQYKIEQMIDS